MIHKGIFDAQLKCGCNHELLNKVDVLTNKIDKQEVEIKIIKGAK
jgi:hypothetical protein